MLEMASLTFYVTSDSCLARLSLRLASMLLVFSLVMCAMGLLEFPLRILLLR